jgi:Protein of unknown function (DUF3606)
MWVDLVRLREAGRKRPADVVLAAVPERGRLTLEPAAAEEAFRSMEPPAIGTAAFFRWGAVEGDFDNLQRLNDARVSRIGEDSFVVVGFERLRLATGAARQCPQAWWCRPVGTTRGRNDECHGSQPLAPIEGDAMPDDPKRTGLDRKLIALTDEDEVRNWCRSLGCDEQQLRKAVNAVGHSADKVREYMKVHKP